MIFPELEGEAGGLQRARDALAAACPEFARLYDEAPALADALFHWPESGVDWLRPDPPDLLGRPVEEILAELLRRVDPGDGPPPFGVPRFTRQVTSGMLLWARNRAVRDDPTATMFLGARRALAICASIGYGIDGRGFDPGRLAGLTRHNAWGFFQVHAARNVFFAAAILHDPAGAMAPARRDASAWARRRMNYVLLNTYLRLLTPSDRVAELRLPFPTLVSRAAQALEPGTLAAARKPLDNRGRHPVNRPLPPLLRPPGKQLVWHTTFVEEELRASRWWYQRSLEGKPPLQRLTRRGMIGGDGEL
jgi:hypothetical protein